MWNYSFSHLVPKVIVGGLSVQKHESEMYFVKVILWCFVVLFIFFINSVLF